MSELIYVDEDGNELYRKPKGKGRPPKNSNRNANGDFIVYPRKESEETVCYITVNRDGEEVLDELKDDYGNPVSRKPRGRGRTKLGFEKQDDGPYKGHYVKIVDNGKIPVTEQENQTEEVFTTHASVDSDKVE